MSDKLSPKQEKFCQNIAVKGMNQADAEDLENASHCGHRYEIWQSEKDAVNFVMENYREVTYETD